MKSLKASCFQTKLSIFSTLSPQTGLVLNRDTTFVSSIHKKDVASHTAQYSLLATHTKKNGAGIQAGEGLKHGSLAVFLHDSKIVGLYKMEQRNDYLFIYIYIFCASFMALKTSLCGLLDSPMSEMTARQEVAHTDGTYFYTHIH